eukprot:scaffold64733_cov62-Phaeocystis_antarctica.AAC.2
MVLHPPHDATPPCDVTPPRGAPAQGECLNVSGVEQAEAQAPGAAHPQPHRPLQPGLALGAVCDRERAEEGGTGQGAQAFRQDRVGVLHDELVQRHPGDHRRAQLGIHRPPQGD